MWLRGPIRPDGLGIEPLQQGRDRVEGRSIELEMVARDRRHLRRHLVHVARGLAVRRQEGAQGRTKVVSLEEDIEPGDLVRGEDVTPDKGGCKATECEPIGLDCRRPKRPNRRIGIERIRRGHPRLPGCHVALEARREGGEGQHVGITLERRGEPRPRPGLRAALAHVPDRDGLLQDLARLADDAVALERLEEAAQRLRPDVGRCKPLDRAVAGEAAEAPAVLPLRGQVEQRRPGGGQFDLAGHPGARHAEARHRPADQRAGCWPDAWA